LSYEPFEDSLTEQGHIDQFISCYLISKISAYLHLYPSIYTINYIHIISKLSMQEINYYFLYNFHTVHAYATVETKKLKIKRDTDII
jgi:hypothetical protein